MDAQDIRQLVRETKEITGTVDSVVEDLVVLVEGRLHKVTDYRGTEALKKN